MPPEFDEEFDEFDEELMDCPECQGEGQVECMACDGTGDDEFDEMCDECGGMGEAFCDAALLREDWHDICRPGVVTKSRPRP